MDIPIDSQTAIVFDLDDTLYNEIDYLKSAYRALSKKLASDSWQVLFADLFSRYRNRMNVFDHVSTTYGVPKNELIDAYRNHFPDIKPFEGVLELMDKIKEKGGKIGIITDGRSATQRSKIDALGIVNYIDHIVISEEIGSEKPEEKNYRLISDALNCGINYYIADNLKKDFIAPNRLGWKTVGVLDNGLNIHSNAHEYLDKGHLPHQLINSISELQIIATPQE